MFKTYPQLFTTSTNTSSPRYHLPGPSHYPPLPGVLQWSFSWAPVSDLIGPQPSLLSMYHKPWALKMKVRSCHFSQWLPNSLEIMSKVFTWPSRLFRCGHWLLLWLNFSHSLLTAFQPHWPYGCFFSMPRTLTSQGLCICCSFCCTTWISMWFTPSLHLSPAQCNVRPFPTMLSESTYHLSLYHYSAGLFSSIYQYLLLYYISISLFSQWLESPFE